MVAATATTTAGLDLLDLREILRTILAHVVGEAGVIHADRVSIGFVADLVGVHHVGLRNDLPEVPLHLLAAVVGGGKDSRDCPHGCGGVPSTLDNDVLAAVDEDHVTIAEDSLFLGIVHGDSELDRATVAEEQAIVHEGGSLDSEVHVVLVIDRDKNRRDNDPVHFDFSAAGLERLGLLGVDGLGIPLHQLALQLDAGVEVAGGELLHHTVLVAGEATGGVDGAG